MQTVAQLKAIHEQLVAELGRQPQYRALKAMDLFLAEMGQIYRAEPSRSENDEVFQQKLNAAIENRIGGDIAPRMRVSNYVPGSRVA
jgi:hypothetical protein